MPHNHGVPVGTYPAGYPVGTYPAGYPVGTYPAGQVYFKAQQEEVEEAEIVANEDGEVVENTAETEAEVPAAFIVMASLLVLMLSTVTACYFCKNVSMKKG